jgi:hypothetical protein
LAFHADTKLIAAADEPRERRFEGAVHGERPAYEPHAPGAGTELFESIDTGLHDSRLVAQAEVVVGGEDENFASTLHLHPGGLRGVEVVQCLIDAVFFELINGVLQTGDEIAIN